jgi:hypothetical protein
MLLRVHVQCGRGRAFSLPRHPGPDPGPFP